MRLGRLLLAASAVLRTLEVRAVQQFAAAPTSISGARGSMRAVVDSETALARSCRLAL
jgi:hypothetical protein